MLEGGVSGTQGGRETGRMRKRYDGSVQSRSGAGGNQGRSARDGKGLTVRRTSETGRAEVLPEIFSGKRDQLKRHALRRAEAKRWK